MININLFDMMEILGDEKELREMGLTEEEIEGYVEFFIDNYDLKQEKGKPQ